MVGQLLRQYEIVARLGEGGMGVVYKARDTKLDRFVAIKVLPASVTADSERHRRFVQEAKAASALNHPNIVTIYDIDRVDDVSFIAMELVEGRTLDQVVGRQGLKLKDLLHYAGQAADALAKSHAAGIVHRDLKPSNIMVTPDGRVKLLDFGLAKLVASDPSGDATTLAPIEPQVRTGEGHVVGTPAYMSPEQAEGKPVDARSDIFSFGAVLYEMATGSRAFRGDSTASTLAAVLMATPPPPSQAVPDLPRELERIILRCLRKEPSRRFQVMADLVVELDEVKTESSEQIPAAMVPKRTSGRLITMAGIVVLVLAAVAAGAWAWLGRSAPLGTPTVRLLTTYSGVERDPALSPDGKQVAFGWNGEQEDNFHIYWKPIDAVKPLQLTTDPAADRYPAWSPTGDQLAFARATDGGGAAVYVTPPVPGSEKKLTDLRAAPGNLSWSPDGKWLATVDLGPGTDENSIVLIATDRADRADRRVVVKGPLSASVFTTLALSPSGRALAYVKCLLNSTNSCDIWLQNLAPDLTPTGESRQLTRQSAAMGHLSWLADGSSLVYSATTDMNVSNYLWRIRTTAGASPERLDFAGLRVSDPSVSSTGNRLVATQGGTGFDIWRFAPATRPDDRFLASSASDVDAAYSPVGSKIVYASARSGRSQDLWIANADGTGLVLLTEGLPGRLLGAPVWSPDAKRIAFNAQGEDGTWNIKVVDAAGGPSHAVTEDAGSENYPAWSADGQSIYFSSARTGRAEVWRVPAAGGAETQVTTSGGGQPRIDGSTLYYRRGPMLFARSLDTGQEHDIVTTLAPGGSPYDAHGRTLWYVTRPPQSRAFEIHVKDLNSGEDRVFDSFTGNGVLTLSVAPDRKSALLSVNRSQGDLILVENFR